MAHENGNKGEGVVVGVRSLGFAGEAPDCDSIQSADEMPKGSKNQGHNYNIRWGTSGGIK